MRFLPVALLYRLLLTLLMGGATAAWAQAAPPPIEDFFVPSAYGGALLSPSGNYVAVRSGAKDRRDFLAVIELATGSAKMVGAFSDADVGRFQWVNDERLVFTATDKGLAQGDVRYGPGLYAVNRDGSRFVQLAQRSGRAFVVSGGPGNRELLPYHTYLLSQPGAQDSDWIYVRSVNFDGGGHAASVDLLRLNTLTGRVDEVARPAPVQEWILDHQGAPRLAVGHARDTTTIWYRDPASGAWRTLARFNTFGGDRDSFDPVGFGPDGKLYVTAHAGADTSTLRTLDLATGKVSKESLVVADGYDFAGKLLLNRNKLLGVRLLADAEGQAWFDPAMQAVQKAIDAARPATANLVSVAAQPGAPWVLVESYSDRLPSAYSLYNTQTGKFSAIGSAHPAIRAAQMGPQDVVRYKARDGREIPALLTLPPGAGKNLPLVVLIHGGPWVRGTSWRWDPENQFLASRGYAVLEPEYRGSTGYGSAHFKAGWKQWGLAMQDDIADGARWAIAQGYADPKRICIAGASYGGYAALMGLVNDPDLFKCGINWAGVTDINLMYDGTWFQDSDISDDYKKYGMPMLVGDQVRDAAQLKATSPIQQAARITQPLLLAYGGADRRVPMYHGKKFYDAVRPTNRQVEWIEYAEEGHGWFLPKNRIDFWTRVERFLDKNIGPGSALKE
ncbi:MAG TPA: prolyl oligopeptidase family serine peptidase [Telluria sp.]